MSQSGSEKALRFPASEIEDVVVEEIRQLLQSRQRLLDAFGTPPDEATKLEGVLSLLDRRLPLLLDNVGSAVVTIVKRVEVQDYGLDVHVGKRALRVLITEATGAETDLYDDIFVLRVEVQFLKYRGKVRLVLPSGSPHAKQVEIPSLIKAIARACEWVDQVVKGQALNQRAIAASIGINERYISRILPLAFLAPDITEAILDGRQPTALSLDDCVNLPMIWTEQRRALRFE